MIHHPKNSACGSFAKLRGFILTLSPPLVLVCPRRMRLRIRKISKPFLRSLRRHEIRTVLHGRASPWWHKRATRTRHPSPTQGKAKERLSRVSRAPTCGRRKQNEECTTAVRRTAGNAEKAGYWAESLRSRGASRHDNLFDGNAEGGLTFLKF